MPKTADLKLLEKTNNLQGLSSAGMPMKTWDFGSSPLIIWCFFIQKLLIPLWKDKGEPENITMAEFQ